MMLVPGIDLAIDAARWHAVCAMRRDAGFWAGRSARIYADRVRYFLLFRDLIKFRLPLYDIGIRDRRGMAESCRMIELPWRGADA